MIITEEVNNLNELAQRLKEADSGLDKIKVAVVGFVFDSDGRLILNRRGPGARDEVGKLQALGGSINQTDKNFREALLRELKEEGGSEATLRIDSFIGGQLNRALDKYTQEYLDWIILGYKVTLLSGELKNSEPDRSEGLEVNFMANFKEEDLSRTTAKFIKLMLGENN